MLKVQSSLKKIVTKLMGTNTKTLHISLPEPLIESAEAQAEGGEFDTVSDYVQSLIWEDLRRRDEEKLEQMLLEGVRSGPGIRMDSKEWKKLWAEVDERIESKKRNS